MIVCYDTTRIVVEVVVEKRLQKKKNTNTIYDSHLWTKSLQRKNSGYCFLEESDIDLFKNSRNSVIPAT